MCHTHRLHCSNTNVNTVACRPNILNKTYFELRYFLMDSNIQCTRVCVCVQHQLGDLDELGLCL